MVEERGKVECGGRLTFFDGSRDRGARVCLESEARPTGLLSSQTHLHTQSADCTPMTADRATPDRRSGGGLRNVHDEY